MIDSTDNNKDSATFKVGGTLSGTIYNSLSSSRASLSRCDLADSPVRFVGADIYEDRADR